MSTHSAESTASSIDVVVPSSEIIPQDVCETADKLGVLRYLPEVIELTREIYGGFSNVSVSVDPDISDDTHIVFRVLVDCSIEEALAMDAEWGLRLAKIIPHCPRVYVPALEFQR